MLQVQQLHRLWSFIPMDGPRNVNTIRPRQNGRHFADDTFKRIFMNENVRISISNSLKFVPKDLINNVPALFQIMAWRRPGNKPLSETMMVTLLKHICVTWPQWVKTANIINWVITRISNQLRCWFSKVEMLSIYIPNENLVWIFCRYLIKTLTYRKW